MTNVSINFAHYMRYGLRSHSLYRTDPATSGLRLGPRLAEWFPKAWISHSIMHHEIHQRQAFWQSG